MREKAGKAGLLWPVVYSLGLGLAVSVTLTLHYADIHAGTIHNYILLDGTTGLRGVGFAVPVFVMLLLLRRVVRDRFAGSERKGNGSSRPFFFAVWGILICAWLPYLLSFYPGGLVGDGAEAMEFVLNPSQPIQSRWGTAFILVLRGFAALGRCFSPDVNLGVFLYVCASFLAYSAVCAGVIATLRRMGLPRGGLVILTGLYAFSGHYASYSIGLWKDGLFGAGIVLFSLRFRRVFQEGAAGKKEDLKTGSIMLFLCLWRNFVAYAALAAGLAMRLGTRGKQGKRMGLVLICAALCALLIQGPVFGTMGVVDTPIEESLAIPLQQVAAVVEAGESLTEDQESVLFQLLPRDDWTYLYAPADSDHIKFILEEGVLRKNLVPFLRVWVQLLFRYPGICLRAHLMETLGFWQPYGGNRGIYFDWFLGVEDLYGRGFAEKDLLLDWTGITFVPGLMRRLPFVPSGTAGWILLLSLTLILCQKGRNRTRLLMLMPFLFCWVTTLLVAPIAYSYRYVEMLAMGLPLFLALPFLREGPPAGGEETPERSRFRGRRLFSGKLWTGPWPARVLASGLGVLFLVLLGAGSHHVGHFREGKLGVALSGKEDLSDYYVTEGLSVNEDGFRWTEGERLTVDFPLEVPEADLEVAFTVIGAFRGTQRYIVQDGAGREVASGEADGPGEIRFPFRAEGNRVRFSMLFPDASTVSQTVGWSDDHRKVALQISRMDFEMK